MIEAAIALAPRLSTPSPRLSYAANHLRLGEAAGLMSQNVFLNGAILGMTKQEIRNKFDEIVAFAEIEKFIDTPVQNCGSGMNVRHR